MSSGVELHASDDDGERTRADGRRGPGVGRSALDRSALAEVARRAKRAELARAAERAAEAAANGLDDAVLLDPGGVRPLTRLLPVPPAARAWRGSRSPDERHPLHRPVYDPYAARRRRTPEWVVAYTTALVVGDLLAAVAGAALAAAVPLALPLPSPSVVALLTVAWPPLVALLGGHAERRLLTGTAEYRVLAVAGLVAMALLGAAAAVVPSLTDLRRPLVLGVPLVVAATTLVRVLLRQRSSSARRRGLMSKDVVLVGRESALADLARRLRRDPAAGLVVVGACVPEPSRAPALEQAGVPVLGSLQDAVRVVDEVRADAVLVASASETAAVYLRELAWRLEGTSVELLVAPGVVEVAPNRLTVRPTSSVPLLRIREPEFRGSRRLVKALVDRVLALVLLVLALPVLLLVALAVKVTSTGPVLYRQRRVGKRGREFDLLKFRSMVVGADTRKTELLELNEAGAVLFKIRKDPRFTPIGAFLRRSSLDELPQLLNVLTGHMSLVGPRPHLAAEVEKYTPEVHRRLLVKPGITGLWQVSGRSDLSWEDSVELDIRYVENWSLGLDMVILWRTARAVLRASGAY